jgi:hypothetical protein
VAFSALKADLSGIFATINVKHNGYFSQLLNVSSLFQKTVLARVPSQADLVPKLPLDPDCVIFETIKYIQTRPRRPSPDFNGPEPEPG